MRPFLLSFLLLSFLAAQDRPALSPRSDVFLQGFYWNSPPGGVWYDSLAALAPKLASAGFGGIWFPSPAKGAGGGFSMGYDPYDHYDFGEFFQKGSKETRFGSRKELTAAITAFHNAGIEVYADAVLRHMMGGELKAKYQCIPFNNGNPIVPDSAYLVFQYPNGSGRFKKSPAQFYPNSAHCFVDGRFVATDPLFRFGEWLDHNDQGVRDSLIAWGKYLRNELKFDGFRLDAVKSVDPAFMAAFLKGANGSGYAVAELWSNSADIGDWLNVAKNQNGANVAMFDFPLRYTLKEMCNNTSGSFDMRSLDNAGLAGAGISGFDYSTFVENHDFDRTGYDGTTDNGHDPVLTDKQLAYAYILFSEGRPCVFFKDYLSYGYAGAIDTLIWIRQNFLQGRTTKRGGLDPFYIGGSGTQDDLAKDIFVARRDGGNGKPAAYIVINDNPNEWRGVWVNTNYPNAKFKDYTHHDVNNNIKAAQGDGRIDLWAPPRSYVIYVPDTGITLNHPPVMNRIPDLTAYTNSSFAVPVIATDANAQPLTYTLSGNPAWLSVTSNGLLSGSPAFSDTALSQIIITVTDPLGAADKDTFQLRVKLNRAPVITPLSDTTAVATKRFERTVRTSDADNDTLTFILQQRPTWLSIASPSGIMSGTPAVNDTGIATVTVAIHDGKGAVTIASFTLTIAPVKDSIIATYRKPLIDGSVQIGPADWSPDWRVAVDSDTDSFWWDRATGIVNNEMYGIYVTWDADSLYLGLDYYLNDINNTAMLYIDAVKGAGKTDFNSTHGWLGDHPKNDRFRADDGIDLFIASYNKEKPSVFFVQGTQSVNITPKCFTVRGTAQRGFEAAIAFNDIYGLSSGLVEKFARVKLVGLAAGGFDYGSGDAVPDNPDVNGDAGPDSLINLASIVLDKNGDGIADPTVIITGVAEHRPERSIPTAFRLEQNFPNPFNPSTAIRFSLPGSISRRTTLTVHDLLGRVVAVLADRVMAPGDYSIEWHAGNAPSGVYLYTLRSGEYSTSRKLLLLK